MGIVIEAVNEHNKVYIRTTIINNNEDTIILNNHGMLNDYGQIERMSSCYAIFIATSLLTNQEINSDPVLFIDNSSFPKTISPIILKKGDSYSFKYLLYDSSSDHWKGIFPSSLNNNIKQISAKVHLKYFLLKDLSTAYETNFVSNILILERT